MERKHLEDWRKSKGLTQEQLAQAVRITTRTIANYEKDPRNLCHASYANVLRIAEVLNIHPDQLEIK
ncbi:MULTISPECIES: helix-turn-helix domain-containing protein [Aerococcus]|uniref:Helix-turn-helix transcriptional regulator n=1 Tax=Aerococcus sanguinicola TaxID=119206 RepID=A0A5N1GNC0_9LACT|nr:MULTISPECIES: helix-turn-helix transcriptional regulator [Aerococcus]KAA9301738.1 helix-turn-helix transcriptional regulator [Aerococcus sanguinicola]MDK6368848.1 helix-turn-helix transcriptional regulator [Aerococcus sp. UMB9870]MDK6680186.1 helix-turn-helix transcriptional regulator [Aerococcus sp. UMB8608]MDK6685709.1 helix-turn-helix transcriptional regulator [Aerococcus sp. UMB8623]MDK6939472.1 helix-turn-helix transcriptional regulator [Aerococcus sp. UMB8487]